MITGVSLFAGIGGLDLAMERADINVTATAEVDKSCRAILHRHFPRTTHFTDVTEVTGADIRETGFDPANGIVASGWPCQGNSVAGLRKGMADPRSGLWRENIRILRELRPRWFVGENVPGILSVRRGADFYEVVSSLAELGYGLAWRVLDAQYAGVPQRRRRVLIVGCLGDPASGPEVLFEPEGGYGDSSAGSEERARAARTSAVSTLQGGGRRGYRVDAEAAAGGHLVPVCVTGDITHTLRSEGADASEDGTGRGTPIVAVPVALRGRDGGSQIEAGEPGDPAYTVRTPAGGGSYPMALVSIAAPLTRGSAAGEGVNPPGRRREDDHNLVAYALSAHHSRNDREQTWVCSRDRMAVRRLTPLECERLQGFPDGWTAGQSDSARYRQLGNAVAVPVIEWLMRRIASAESISDSAERKAA